MRSLGKCIGYAPRPPRSPFHRSVPNGLDEGTYFRLGDNILVEGFATGAHDHGVNLQVKVRFGFGEDDD